MNYPNDSVIKEVWEKASRVAGVNPDFWRKDFAGAWIQREQYGMSSEFGWEVCHMCPRAVGGSDDLSNLRAIHWKNHRSKAANYPVFKTKLSSEGVKNVEKERIWKIGK